MNKVLPDGMNFPRVRNSNVHMPLSMTRSFTSPLPSLRTLLSRGFLFAALLVAAAVWAETPLSERYTRLITGTETTLPGTSISLVSTEQNGTLSAEATSILPYPFATAAPALAKVENWCQFMPLHFNIKACTYQTDAAGELLTLYSGRKTYQTPGDSHLLVYRVVKREQTDGQMALLLRADSGPAGTRDYRIEVDALRVKEGTLFHIRTSYRSSMTSSLLTHTYLSTAGRDKVGFTRVEQDGVLRPVQGMRGVIERKVMRYQIAIDTFLSTRHIPEAAQREAALAHWFKQNDSYPQQLHEMTEHEYLAIKRREWDNQQRLQQALNDKQQVALR